MAYTQDDIATLKKAIASGAKTVRFGRDEVTYRTLQEMKDALATMEREVNGDSRPRVSFASFSSR